MSQTNEISLKTRDLRAAGDFAEAGHCRAPGCGHTTADRKPYCLHHIDRMFYARKILEELAAQEALHAVAVPGLTFKKAV